MCKLQYLTNFTSVAIKRSIPLLNDTDLFGDRKLCDQALTRELDQAYREEDIGDEGCVGGVGG